jgi:hypothetical protein
LKTFTDTEGRLWNVKGTLGAFERVKTSTGVDMLDLPSTQKCLGQISDVFTLGKVLYAMCEQQCDARSISPEDFADGFNADVLVEASNALLEEVVFFCRKDLRPAMQMALDKARQADERMIAKMQGQAAAMEQQMDRAMESLWTSTDSVTSSLESSASTPANGRSAGSSGPRPAGKKKRGATPAL